MALVTGLGKLGGAQTTSVVLFNARVAVEIARGLCFTNSVSEQLFGKCSGTVRVTSVHDCSIGF